MYSEHSESTESLKVSKHQKEWITFKVSVLEMEALEAYCQKTQRTKTDVLRELIRKLETYQIDS